MPSQQLVEIILKAQDQASQTAKKVDDSIKNIGKSSSMLSKIPGFDSLKTKLGNVATTIDNKFGGALTKARNRISNFTSSISSVGSTIKGKFGGAIDGVRNKLSSFANGAKNAASSMSFLKGAASMAVGIIGYDLVSSLVESTRASMNARSSIQAFGQRLNMSGTEVASFQSDLDKLQSTFKKVDMDVVGQQAMDMAYRLGLPKTSLTELTETSAIFTDAMQRNGRSAEDATLALADAMDGEFKRLKEIGISQEDLMNNGWSGDINDKTGLLKAMNKALKDQHYDELAKSVDNLDDAWQVLTISLSNLLESVLVPLTPAIVGLVSGITSVVEGLKGAVGFINNNGWLQGALLIGGLALGFGLLAGAISLAAAAEGGLMALMPAFITQLAAVAAEFLAISIAGAPLWAILAVVAAIAIAVYELGIAFGWWSDVGSMLAAIQAGLTRMWNAFINHPDVQAAISVISNALSTLWSWIQQAGQAILSFFGIATGGEWDIVHSLIMGIGVAWEIWSAKIRVIYDLLMMLAPYVMEVFGVIGEQVANVVSVFQQFQDGQLSLIDVVIAVGTALFNVWWSIQTQITTIVLTLVSNLLSWAIQAGLNVLTGIATYLSQVPMRVYTYLLNTLNYFISVGSRWVSQARSKASQVVNGIVSFLRQLPGKALSALLGVVSSIVSAGSQWVSNARSKASEVVSNVVSTLSGLPGQIAGALSGVVDAITKPFRDAYNTLTGIVDSIKSKASEVANISLPFGGDLPMGGDLAVNARGGDISYDNNGNTVNDNLTVDINQNVTLDLANVPSHIDTNTLISALQNREVLRALIDNRDFQNIDAQVKERINYKVNRSRGI